MHAKSTDRALSENRVLDCLHRGGGGSEWDKNDAWRELLAIDGQTAKNKKKAAPGGAAFFSGLAATRQGLRDP